MNLSDHNLTEQEKNQVRDTFLELVRIDNPSLKERKMADHILAVLRELGVEAVEDDSRSMTGGDTGNIYAYLPGNAGPEDDLFDPVLLSAHLDCVNPACKKRPVLHEDGVITSDGSTVLGGDDLAGVAVILETLRFLLQSGVKHRPVEVVFFAAEELYDVGSEFFDFKKIKSKEAYVLDASGEVGGYLSKAPTIFSFEAEFRGKAAHAGFEPEKGIHAIQIAGRALSSLVMGRIDEETTVNIGEIRGGSGTNIVPESCVVSGEVRSYSHPKAVEQTMVIRKHFESTASLSGASVVWKERECMRAYEVSPDEAAPRHFAKICEDLGISCRSMPSFGGSDNNQLAAHGINGIVLCIGMTDVHSVHESIRLEDMYRLTVICEALLLS